MDKLCKIHVLSQLKARMPLDRAEFVRAKVPKEYPQRSRYVGSALYVHRRRKRSANPAARARRPPPSYSANRRWIAQFAFRPPEGR